MIFVPLAFAAVFLGAEVSTFLIFDVKWWCLFILLYCFIASLMPVWLLLQPRGYLGGFFLYAVLAIGVFGLFFGNFEIKQSAFKGFEAGNFAGSMFPFLFVTIACGACSGFHGLVCSGTTAKQIDRETHTHAVGYGAMLCEAFVAVIALGTVMIWAPEEIVGLKPGAIYAKGIGEFLSLMLPKEYLHLAITFGAMAFSTFVFDTLDVSTRLGRYLLQELFQWKSRLGAIVATMLTIAAPLGFVVLANEGSYLQFWSLFGASNQLLAALTLLSITIWLYQAGRRIAFTLLPMLFVLTITLWALAKLAWGNLTQSQGFSIGLVNGIIAISLIILAIYLVISALLRITRQSVLKSDQAINAIKNTN
jgi:carbon starvation protein